MLYVISILGVLRLGLDVYLTSSTYSSILEANYATLYSDIPLIRFMAIFAQV